MNNWQHPTGNIPKTVLRDYEEAERVAAHMRTAQVPMRERWDERGRSEAFKELRLQNGTVSNILASGGTVEDCALALAEINNRLIERILELEGIAPRKIKMPDGSVAVWHCPDEFIPQINVGKLND
jgi:hypothetical protein